MAGKRWSPAELIVACAAVADAEWERPVPDVRYELAAVLERPVASVDWKLANLISAAGGRPTHHTRCDAAVVEAFRADPPGMYEAAHLLKVALIHHFGDRP